MPFLHFVAFSHEASSQVQKIQKNSGLDHLPIFLDFLDFFLDLWSKNATKHPTFFRAYLVTIIKALLHIDFLISFVPLQYETICETQFNCAGTADLRAFLFIRTHIVAVQPEERPQKSNNFVQQTCYIEGLSTMTLQQLAVVEFHLG